MAQKLLFEIEVTSDDRALNELNKEIDNLKNSQKHLLDQQKKNGSFDKAQRKRHSDQATDLKVLVKERTKLTKAIVHEKSVTKGLVSEYAKESKRLNDLRHQLKDMILTEKKGSKATAKLANEVSRLDTKLKGVDKQAGQFQRSVGNYSKGVKGFGSSLTGAAVGAAAMIGGIQGLISFGRESIAAVGEQEKAEKSLEVALGRRSQALLDQASALQKTTKFGDEATIQGQAFLAQMGMSEEQILKLTPSILDFAEAQGISVADASKLLAKSLGSSTNALSRYGIEIDGAAGSNERVQSAVDSLSKAFDGQAVAAAGVGTGALTNMSNRMGDLQEKFGAFLLKGLNPVADGTSFLGKAMDDVSVGLDVLNGDMDSAKDKFSIFALLITSIKNQFSLMWNVLKLITIPWRVFFDLVGRAAEKFGFVKEAAIDFQVVLLDIQNVIIRLPQVFDIVTDAIISTVMGLVDVFLDYGKVLAEVFNFAKIIKEGTGGVKDAVANLGKTMSDAFDKGLGGVPDKVAALFDDTKKAEDSAGKAGEALGKSIAEGTAKGLKDNREKIQIALSKSIAERNNNQIAAEKKWIKDTTDGMRKEASKDRKPMLTPVPEEGTPEWNENISRARAFTAKAGEELTAAGLEISQQTSDAIFAQQQANNERSKQYEIDQLTILDERKQDQLQSQLDGGLITQAEYENNRLVLEKETQAARLKIEQESFDRGKRIDTAQAIINGALAITKTIAQLGGVGAITPAGAVALGTIAATTALNVGVIQSQKFADGGMINGNSHAQGGVPMLVDGSRPIEAEGGEFIINKAATAQNLPLIEAINNSTLSAPTYARGGYMPKYANGGVVRGGAGGINASDLDSLRNGIVEGINNIQVTNVASETIGVAQNAISIENEMSI